MDEKPRHLIISRRKGEALKIDGPAMIVIEDVIGKIVRVGILAQESTRVVRDDAVRKERNNA